MNHTRVPYLFITGASYSGSTLLSFLLNAHPDCVSVGESNGLTDRVDPDTYECSCGALFSSCPFWMRMCDRMKARGFDLDLRAAEWVTEVRVSTNRYWNFLWLAPAPAPVDALRRAALPLFPRLRERLHMTALANEAFARSALEERSARVFVDASKAPRRVRVLSQAPGIDLYVIHLVRDARGGTASFMANSSLTVSRAAREWVIRNRSAERARRFVPPARWMVVRYGDLCRDVQGTIDSIADFAGFDRAAVPEDFLSVEHHVVGNRMRLRGRTEIREDRSWETVLGPGDLAEVARRCGRWNRHFGYSWLGS